MECCFSGNCSVSKVSVTNTCCNNLPYFKKQLQLALGFSEFFFPVRFRLLLNNFSIGSKKETGILKRNKGS